jgi:hypothetical protein
MEFWRILQTAYLFFHLTSAGIFAIALVTVVNWPSVRGRGLLFAALAVRLIAMFGYLAMNLINFVAAFTAFQSQLPAEVMPIGYLLLAVIGLASDGLLLAALIGLAGGLRRMQPKEGFPNAPLNGVPEK